jgi:hypothetical protein
MQPGTAVIMASNDKRFSPEAAEGVQRLKGLFNGVCAILDLDESDEARARKIARVLIEATMAGESDPDTLIRLAVKAVSN